VGGNKNKRCWRKGKESEEGNEGTRVRVKRGGVACENFFFYYYFPIENRKWM